MEAPSLDLIAPRLAPEEQIVWRHAPPPRDIIRSQFGILIFLLVFLAFFLVWTGMQVNTLLHGSAGPNFNVFALIMTVIGCGFITMTLNWLWPVLQIIRTASSTQYALTNRRFLSVSTLGMIEYAPALFARMEANEKLGILSFDWGERRTRKRVYETFRESLHGLEQPAALAALIRTTFGLQS